MQRSVAMLFFVAISGYCPSALANHAEHTWKMLMDGPRDHIFVAAHRGVHLQAPENSLAAVQNAIDMKVDIVEMDVRFTKDDIPVLMHDDRLDRTTTGTGYVAEKTYEELSHLRLKKADGGVTTEGIPKFTEALVMVRRAIVVDLHLKVDRAADIAKALDAAHVQHLLVYADDPVWLRHLSALEPDAVLLPLAKHREQVDELQQGFELKFMHLEPEYISLDLTRELRVRDIRTWVNALGKIDSSESHDPTAYNALIASRPTVIQTDRPDLLLTRLQEIGLH